MEPDSTQEAETTVLLYCMIYSTAVLWEVQYVLQISTNPPETLSLGISELLEQIHGEK